MDLEFKITTYDEFLFRFITTYHHRVYVQVLNNYDIIMAVVFGLVLLVIINVVFKYFDVFNKVRCYKVLLFFIRNIFSFLTSSHPVTLLPANRLFKTIVPQPFIKKGEETVHPVRAPLCFHVFNRVT